MRNDRGKIKINNAGDLGIQDGIESGQMPNQECPDKSPGK